MYCRKCGTEVQSEHDEYCKNCIIQNEHVSVGVGESSQNSKAILGGSSPDLGSPVTEQARNDIFLDDDVLEPTDPIDFLLEEPSASTKNESKIDLPDEDTIEAEPVINALTKPQEDEQSLTDDFDFSSLNDDYDDDGTDKVDQVDEDSSFEETVEEDQETSDDSLDFDDLDDDDEPENIDEPIFGYMPEDIEDEKEDLTDAVSEENIQEEGKSDSSKKNEFGDKVFDWDKPKNKGLVEDHSEIDNESTEDNQLVAPDEIISKDDQPLSELFDDTEDKKHTQKIDLEEVKKEIDMAPPKLDIPKAKNPGTKKIPVLTKIVKPKGVAYIKGNNLTFSGGFKPFSGQELTIENKVFQIKTKQTNSLQLYGIIGAGIVAFIIIAYIISGMIGTNYGQLAGIVYGSYGSTALADQVVKIKELNKTTTTNHAGFFVFDNLKSGVYTLQYIDNGLVVNERTVTVLKDKTSTIILGDSGSQTSIDEGYIGNDVASTPPVQKAAVTVASASTVSYPGILKLAVKPSNAKAYLNNKPLGAGSKTYKVSPGTYTLSVKRNGYITESKTITLRSEKTLSYKFNLTKNNNELTDSESLYNKAHNYEIAGNYPNALKYYERVLNNDTRHVKALIGRARCFKEQGQIDKSLTSFVQASHAANKKNDMTGRIEAINGIITIKPNNFTAYYDRGVSYYALENYLKASADFQKVVSLDKRNLKAYYYLGDSYYESYQFNEALIAYQAAEELHFADPKAQVQIAKTYFILGDLKNSKKAYEKFNEMASKTKALEFNSDPEWKNIVDTFSQEN